MKFKPKKPKGDKAIKSKGSASAATAPAPDADEAEDDTPLLDISAHPSLASHSTKLAKIVNNRQLIADKIKALEAQKREYDKQIAPILFRAGVKKVRVDGWPVYSKQGTRTFLNEIKLIEEFHVDPKAIAACKEKKKTAAYIQVGKRGEDGGEEE